MSHLAVAACVLYLNVTISIADPSSIQLTAVIFNNTHVDLEIEVNATTHETVTLQPGQETRSRFAASQWINFGMIAHQYVLPDDVVSYAGPATIYLQAEPDGNLYLVPPQAGFSGSPPEQPAGFPLRPVNVVDLT